MATGIYIKNSEDIKLIKPNIKGLENGIVIEGGKNITSFGANISVSAPIAEKPIRNFILDRIIPEIVTILGLIFVAVFLGYLNKKLKIPVK